MKTVFLSGAARRSVQSTTRAHPLHEATTQILKVILQPSFLFHPQRWVVHLVVWWFENGFRVDGLNEQGVMHSGGEKRSNCTTRNPLCSSHYKPQSWLKWNTTVTERHVGQISLFFSLFCFDRVTLFPGTVQTLHTADAMTFFFFFKLLGSAGETQWPQEAERQKVHRHS